MKTQAVSRLLELAGEPKDKLEGRLQSMLSQPKLTVKVSGSPKVKSVEVVIPFSGSIRMEDSRVAKVIEAIDTELDVRVKHWEITIASSKLTWIFDL